MASSDLSFRLQLSSPSALLIPPRALYKHLCRSQQPTEWATDKYRSRKTHRARLVLVNDPLCSLTLYYDSRKAKGFVQDQHRPDQRELVKRLERMKGKRQRWRDDQPTFDANDAPLLSLVLAPRGPPTRTGLDRSIDDRFERDVGTAIGASSSSTRRREVKPESPPSSSEVGGTNGRSKPESFESDGGTKGRSGAEPVIVSVGLEGGGTKG
jgi:hypothetical protein